MRAPVIVGREDELAKLGSRLIGDSSQLPHVFLIAGEAGIGKSALVGVFRQRAESAGAHVFIGECSSVEVGRPFGPLVEVLMRAQRAPQTRGVVERALADPDLPLPVLLPDRGARAPKATDPSERYRAHAAVLGMLLQMSRIRPLVVVIEDAHWADEATLDFLPYAVRRLGSERLLLLVTYRSDELHRLHPFVPVLDDLRRLGVVEELRLPALGRAETAAMIQQRLGLQQPPEAHVRDAIFERCEGNPYFTDEVLRTVKLDSEGVGAVVSDRPGGHGAIPASIRDALWTRLAVLDPPTRHIMQLAAIIGHRFDFDLLQRVSGASDDALLAALRVMVDAHVIEEAADAAGRSGYVFRHALMHEAVLGELLERQRRSFHRVVGLALEGLHAENPSPVAGELAFQFDAADDAPRACRYHDLAARLAESALAFRSASRHLQRAIARAPDDDRVLGDLEGRLASAARYGGNPALSVQACESALARMWQPGDERRRGSIHAILADAQWYLGNRTGADAAIAEAIGLLEPLGETAELALAYAISGARRSIAGDTAHAIEVGGKAIALARRLDVPDALGIALMTVGEARTVLGDRRGLDEIREAIDVGVRHGLAEVTLAAYGNLAIALRALGAPPAEARTAHEESAVIARRTGHYRDRFFSHDVDYLIADGKWDAALRETTEIGDTIWREATLLQVAVIHTLRIGPDALTSAAPHRARLLAAKDPQWVARAASFSAAALLVHDLGAALEFAEDLLASPNSSALTWGAATRISAIAAACELGDAGAKRTWIERTLADPRPVEARMATAARAFARAAATENVDEAIRHLDTAVPLLEGEILPLAEVVVRLRRAELRSAAPGRTDHAAAREDLAVVRNFAERAGAAWFLEDLRRWADAHGLRESAAGPDATNAVLTRREREIAGLVARGLTDREIATHLVIGQRTAEGHVAHILEKLGFRTRSEIATWSTKDQLAPPSTSASRKHVPTDT